MKIPAHIASKTIGNGFFQNGNCSADGLVTWNAGVYPLPGCLFWLFVGSEPEHCYYWPLGREDGEPIVCRIWDDYGGMLPLASSLEAYVRLEYACSDVEWNDTPEEADEKDWMAADIVQLSNDFDIDLKDVPKFQ